MRESEHPEGFYNSKGYKSETLDNAFLNTTHEVVFRHATAVDHPFFTDICLCFCHAICAALAECIGLRSQNELIISLFVADQSAK